MRLWPFRRHVDPIDTLIKKPRVLHVGHDEALEERTRQRRQQAVKIRRAALLIDTTDRVPLRRVK